MEVTEQISLFQKFMELHYLAEFLEVVRKGQMYFVVDFAVLSKFSPEIRNLKEMSTNLFFELTFFIPEKRVQGLMEEKGRGTDHLLQK